MKSWVVACCSLLLVFASALSCAQDVSPIRIPQSRSADDTGYLYFSELLTKALHKGANGRRIPPLAPAIPMSTERKIHELRLGRTLDLFWLAGSKSRARDLLVVPIPLERGLIGYKQFIINKNKAADFDGVKTVGDLARLKACQEAHWVDANIFRDAQLPMVTSVNFENLYKQLAAGRCDYFPRGYHEARIELARRKDRYPDLMVYEPLILHYPFAAYFFVHKDNKVLAQWLQDGLEAMIDDGELLTFMMRHEHTRSAFPLGGAAPKRMLEIPNHYLPDFSNDTNIRYWFQASDFVAVADSR